MRILVCGGRDYADHQAIKRALDTLRTDRGVDCIITGCADGADRWARNWARLSETDLMMFAAKWSTEGRKAGPNRNARMLSVGRPDLVIAFPGGRGTADMVKRARAAGVEVREIGSCATTTR